MAMTADEIKSLLGAAFPDGTIIVVPLEDDGDHFATRIVSRSFAGKTIVQQHQMVYAALRGHMGAALHALAIETKIDN